MCGERPCGPCAEKAQAGCGGGKAAGVHVASGGGIFTFLLAIGAGVLIVKAVKKHKGAK